MSDLTFRSAPPPSEPEDLDPVPFSLSVWRTKPGADPTEETHGFDCKPRAAVSGKHITDVTLAADAGNLAAAAAAWQFFGKVMDPDDLRRLDDLLNEEDVYVDQGVLIEAAGGLFELYAGRPTRPQRRSAAGQKGRARTSTARRG